MSRAQRSVGALATKARLERRMAWWFVAAMA
jgi:hypothetical protein